jgi:hypothetical protein
MPMCIGTERARTQLLLYSGQRWKAVPIDGIGKAILKYGG